MTFSLTPKIGADHLLFISVLSIFLLCLSFLFPSDPFLGVSGVSGIQSFFLGRAAAGKIDAPKNLSPSRNAKHMHLGTFATAEEAHAAYVKAKNEVAGEFSPYTAA